jgi:GNAT superfamily N-acetyltransferase
MASLFSQFAKEYHKREVLEYEHGFASYEILGDSCYVADIFVEKEWRREGVATELLCEIEAIAKEKNCNWLLGSVIPSYQGSSDSMHAALWYGFKIQKSHENFIWLIKEIE